MQNYCISKAIFVIGIELLAQKPQKQLFKGNSGVAPMRALAPPRCPPPARPPRLHLLIPMPFRSSNDNIPVVVLIREARSEIKAKSHVSTAVPHDKEIVCAVSAVCFVVGYLS